MKAALLFTVCLGLVLGLVSAAAVKHDADAIKSVTDHVKTLVDNLDAMVKMGDNTGKTNLKDQLDMEKLTKDVLDSLTIEGTEAEDETLSNVEDGEAHISLGDDARIGCASHGLAIACCHRISLNMICIAVAIKPPSSLVVVVTENRKVIYLKTIASRPFYNVCVRKGGSAVFCIHLTHVLITSHYGRYCLKFSLRVGHLSYIKNFGCIRKTYITDESETPTFFDLFNTNHKEKQQNREIPLLKKSDGDQVLVFQQRD